MKNTYCNIFKLFAFVLIFVYLWNVVFSVLWLDNSAAISEFYKEDKNSLDIVYIGGSFSSWHFNPTLAFDKYGFAVGLLGAESQPPLFAKYMIEESEKYQHPELYIIDISNITENYSSLAPVVIRKTLDNMRISQNKINLINEIIKYRPQDKKSYYYFSYLLYHNSWRELTEKNFVRDTTLYKGYRFREDRFIQEEQEKPVWNSDVVTPISKENEEMLYELLDYLKEKKINVLFVISTEVTSYAPGLNYVSNIIEQNNFSVLNFSTAEDFQIDYKTDHDLQHLNAYGATKFTLYFSKYLKENYDLPDHRNDKEYSSWKSEYERFKKDFKKYSNEDFDEYLKTLGY